jgi:N-acetylneuraminic acid mutarotase
MLNSPRYLVSLALFTLAACQDATTDLEQEGVAEAAAVTSNAWQQRARMPSDRRFVMTATVEAPGSSFLYVIGGKSMNDNNFCSGSLSKVQAYDGNTNTWTTKAPLPFPTHRGLVGVINGRIYVVGGCRELTLAWEYTVATNQWRQKTSAPMSLPTPIGSLVGGKLYLFDECSYEACQWDPSFTSGREQYTFFGYYDPATDTWVRRPLPPLGVWPIAAATFNGKLYFLGRHGQVNIYTPSTGTWTSGASRGPQELALVTTAVVRGKWYVVGRESSSGANFLFVYDPASNTWVKRATPPAAYLSDWSNGPSAGRVWANGIARLELVGGLRPNNNWQYTP